METELVHLISSVKSGWESTETKKISSLLQNFVTNKLVVKHLQNLDLSKGLELYRDQAVGFMLFAYSELEGSYRAPHNHGKCWVIYTVLEGQVEMRAFKKVDDHLQVKLLGEEILRAGDVRIYESGDIHDTRCLSGKAIILRFTSCDLKKEELEGHMLRFHL